MWVDTNINISLTDDCTYSHPPVISPGPVACGASGHKANSSQSAIKGGGETQVHLGVSYKCVMCFHFKSIRSAEDVLLTLAES